MISLMNLDSSEGALRSTEVVIIFPYIKYIYIDIDINTHTYILVGGLNPSEKY